MATTVKSFSKKVQQWAEYSQIDLDKVTENGVQIERLSKQEAIQEGCDSNYPYRLHNPYSLDVSAE